MCLVGEQRSADDGGPCGRQTDQLSSSSPHGAKP
jgi:hypothetical protein